MIERFEFAFRKLLGEIEAEFVRNLKCLVDFEVRTGITKKPCRCRCLALDPSLDSSIPRFSNSLGVQIGVELAPDRSPNSWELTFIGRLLMAGLYYCICTITSYLEELDESAEAFEHKTPFSQQLGISESCCKDPFGLCINLHLCTVSHLPKRDREAATGVHGDVGGGGGGEWGDS